MTAEPLSALDAAFLAVETPSMPMHVVAVAVVAPGPDGLGVAAVRRLVARRLGGQRRLWQRVGRVPFGLDHPVWVDDPDVDLAHHVQSAALPAPGGPGELAAFVAGVAGRPLDADRPLWELVVVEGLDRGHVALVAKVHHALFDGVSGLAALAGLFDPEPPGNATAGREANAGANGTAHGSAGNRPADGVGSGPGVGSDGVGSADGVGSGPGATPLDVLSTAARRWARRPLTLADTLAGTYLTVRRWGPAPPGASPSSPAPAPGAMPLPFRVPRAPWNGTISARRAVAIAPLSMDDLRAVTARHGGTCNDVLLAAVGGALRRRAARHPGQAGLHPGSPLVAAVPVSGRPTGGRAPGAGGDGNRVTAMLVPLATDVAGAEDRLRAVQVAAAAAKERLASVPEHLVLGWAELAVPALTTRLARLAGNLRAFDHLAPPVNVVVSNVAGPQEPLWCVGGRVVDLLPFGPVADGIALNLSAVSYRGTLSVGLIGCRDRVGDLDQLASDLADAVAELSKGARSARA